MKIVIKKVDGSVAIMTLMAEAAQASAYDLDIVVNAEIAAWHENEKKKVISWRAMPDNAIPTDRTFRDAWADTTKKTVIDIDMAKAREVWKDRMRAARKPLLAAADVEFIRAIESGTDTKMISDHKRALRDVTKDQAIDSAKTPEELKTVWPATLGQ